MPPHGPGFMGALHSHDPEYPEDEWNLYSMIDPEQLVCFNATRPEDAAGIFRPFVHRLNEAPFVESNADEELIIVIPFTSPCHIRKMMLIGGGTEDQHPFTVKCYANKEDLTFATVNDVQPQQVFTNLDVNETGTNELILQRAPFTNVSKLTLYICENRGAESSILRYIGFQGEHTHHRQEPVDAEYEVLCNGQDIEQPDDQKTLDNIGF